MTVVLQALCHSPQPENQIINLAKECAYALMCVYRSYVLLVLMHCWKTLVGEHN